MRCGGSDRCKCLFRDRARVVRDEGSCLKGKMSENNSIKDLVRFGEESMPAIEACLRDKYEAGYNARIQGKPRMIAHSRRQGAWKRGWDAADQVLAKRKKKREKGKGV